MLEDTKRSMPMAVGKIAKVMAGICPYSVWKDVREPKKEEDKRLEKWRTQHDDLVSLFIEEFKESHPGWVIVTEHDVELEGMTGRIDVLTRGKGNKFQIWEIKTGKEYPHHHKQLELYVAMEKKKNPQASIEGHLKYIDGEPIILTLENVDHTLDEALRSKNLLTQGTPPGKKYCSDCKWCTYKDSTCPVF